MSDRIKGLSNELIFYNDLKSLQRSIPTYIEFVDCIIAIDGMHRTDKQNNYISDDGSREYLQSFDKVKLINGNRYLEVSKRKLAKELCPTTDLIIIDSDEYVIGNWEEFFKNYEKAKKDDKHNLHIYTIKLQRLDYPEGYYNHPKLVYKPWEFTYYRNKHAILVKKTKQNEDGIYAPSYYQKPIDGITIMHDHKLRSPERMQIRQDHIQFLFRHKL